MLMAWAAASAVAEALGKFGRLLRLRSQPTETLHNPIPKMAAWLGSVLLFQVTVSGPTAVTCHLAYLISGITADTRVTIPRTAM